ncbi:SdiA-regulated domain-containing protein [Salmonella enterica]|nr:SdiA-regulated domain-containing protein [Salmonella enterica]EIG9443732.1 SdiA-regulated domain-containing protein [Salmonella enterica]EIG9453412.1 SdiA-regulated domain-containing protein [Salmonella enterica]
MLTLCFPESWYPQETEWQLTAEKEITGIHGGLSGLTWNPDSRTLFAVTDPPLLDGGAGHGRERAAGDTVRRRPRF